MDGKPNIVNFIKLIEAHAEGSIENSPLFNILSDVRAYLCPIIAVKFTAILICKITPVYQFNSILG